MNCRNDGLCQQAIDYGTEGMASCPAGKCVQPQPCWSCRKDVTMASRADADGDCPHCGVALDIECWPFLSAPPALAARLEEALVRLVAVEQNAAQLAKWEKLLGEVRKG